MTTAHSSRTDSVEATEKLLDAIIAKPATYCSNSVLFAALRTQGSLARYKDEELKIWPQSLNTVKRICAAKIAGGFAALDAKRNFALQALSGSAEQFSDDDQRNKAGLQLRITELKKQNQLLLEELCLMTDLFNRSLAEGKNYALSSKDARTIDLCKKEQRLLLDMMSLRRTSRRAN